MPVLVRPGPLGRRIRWRDKLRDHVGSRPQAVSSRVAMYSFMARLVLSGSRSLCQSCPAIERYLLASAWIKLASTSVYVLRDSCFRSTDASHACGSASPGKEATDSL